MRTLLRTTLVTMLVMFSVLIAWSFIRSPNSAESAQAAPGTDIPGHCAADLAERLAKLKDPAERQAAIQAELQCAADAQTYPAKKLTALAKFTPPVFPPTEIPGPTATLQVGIQNTDLGVIPQIGFLPIENNNNLWADLVSGNVVQVAAGSALDRDENWRQDHPEWATQGAQGALYVVMNYDGLKGKLYPTPSRNGAVHLVTACGSILVLQAADNTIFTFDVAKLAYVNNSTACPIPTP